MTADVDAIIHAASSMKDAINRVGDKFNLPNNWLNRDFVKTVSYSPKLDKVSVYYKTYSNVLTVRVVTDEYLVAMKLRSGRKYKNDLSDIIGILADHEDNNNSLSMDMIDNAVNELYGGWNDFPEDSKPFIETAIRNGNFEEIYTSVKTEEKNSREILIAFDRGYENVLDASNTEDILKTLKSSL